MRIKAAAVSQWGLWLSQESGGFPMHQTFAESGTHSSFGQESGAHSSLGQRLEVIAQRLEGPAWIGLFASICYAGYLAVSM
jgi:hypothetical protein